MRTNILSWQFGQQFERPSVFYSTIKTTSNLFLEQEENDKLWEGEPLFPGRQNPSF